MKYILVHTKLGDEPIWWQMADDLGIPAAQVLGCFISFAGRYLPHRAKGGECLRDIHEGVAENWACWRGEPGAFIAALRLRAMNEEGELITHRRVKLESQRPARPPVPRQTREAVLRRDGFQCRYCGTETDLQLDHVWPYSRGGTHDAGNLQTLCGPCNRAKSNKVN